MSPDARAAALLTALFAGSGTLHLVRPRTYEPIVPPHLGSPRAWVLVSGVAELGCAALLAVPRTRRTGGLASAALLAAVFPANLWSVRVVAGRPLAEAVALARLPLQLPLIADALTVAGAPPGRRRQ